MPRIEFNHPDRDAILREAALSVRKHDGKREAKAFLRDFGCKSSEIKAMLKRGKH